MSSTSSSECMCGECYSYLPYRSQSFRTRAPYYQTLGHPLIYYAQVPQPNIRRQGRESRKEKTSCFSRAFRWYTRDLIQSGSRELPNDRTDITGFAAWLDKKYDEFMLAKQSEQEDFKQTQPQTSQHENEKPNQAIPDGNKNNTSRLKSPFMKRRRTSSSAKECGDTPNECREKSFEFILKPKELSRPTSECCNHIPSNETQASKRTIIKLKTFSSERFVYSKCDYAPIETVKVEGNQAKSLFDSKKPDMKAIEYNVSRPSGDHVKDAATQCPEEQLVIANAQTQCEEDPKTKHNCPLSDYYCCPNCGTIGPSVLEQSAGPSKVQDEFKNNLETRLSEATETGHAPNKSRHFSNNCQCITEDYLNSTSAKTSNKVQNKEVEIRPLPKPETQKRLDSFEKYLKSRTSQEVQISDAQNQFKRGSKNVSCNVEVDLKPTSSNASNQVNQPHEISMIACHCQKANTHPQRHLVIKEIITFDTDAAQTSDHSIRLEDTDTYPFFMKIICADKLNEPR